MSEAVAVSNHQKDTKTKLTKHVLLIIVTAIVYTTVLVALNLAVRQYVAEEIYAFLGAYLFVGFSGVLYGIARLYYRTKSMAEFSSKLKTVISSLLVTMLLAQLFILAGYVVFIIPGIVLMLFFFFYPFVVVEEGIRNLQALKRSMSLVASTWFRLLIYIGGFYILYLLLGGLILLFAPNGLMLAEVISGSVLFPVEVYVFYRLYGRAVERNKKKKGGVKK